MHMPGHKRNTALLGAELPYALDITELPGFDNLHDMRGTLAETAALAAELYGARRAFPLVNGATGGVLAAISAVCPRGGTLIMARSCHKSVYNAAELNGLDARYIPPEPDGRVTPESVEKALRENENASLVALTSPTYDGVVSDIAAISKITRAHGVPLFIDAAHGAHFGFSPSFPEGPAKYADVTVVSLHKTLPALTQCALLLCNRFGEELARRLAVFETSSPSYVLLGSIDRCARLIKSRGAALFAAYEENLSRFYGAVKPLQTLEMIRNDDPGKIVVSARRAAMTGRALFDALRNEYGVEPELFGADYALAMTSVCDTAESFRRLSDAICALDARAKPAPPREIPPLRVPERRMPPHEAANCRGAFAPLEQAVGATSLEYVWAYPPGVPLLVPGEVIGADFLAQIREMRACGVEPKSTKNALPERIFCV
jgi:arginine/lysine/ornithine decarboxylase